MKFKSLILGAALSLTLAGCGEAPAVKVKVLTLDHISETLVVGDELQLNVTVEPENATNKEVTWSTGGDEGVVSVSEEGMVKALKAGAATVTATAKDGSGVNVSCAIFVEDPVYPEGTFHGVAVIAGGNFQVVVAMGNEDNKLAAVRISNVDAVVTASTFDTHTKVLQLTTTGEYSSMTFGKITAKYDPQNNKLKELAFDGTIKDQVTNNGQIEATRFTAGEQIWECDENTDGLREVFKRRYGDPWTVDTKNDDRIVSNTEQYVSGAGAMKVRAWNGGRYALNFLNDFNPVKSVKNVQFWVYNPGTADVTIRMWYYTAAGLTGAGETGSVTAKAGGWTYVAMGFGTNDGQARNLYNFQIADFTNKGVAMTFDNIVLF